MSSPAESIFVTVDGADSHGVLDQARHVLEHDYGIVHGTFQIEPDNHVGCEEVTW